MSLVNPMNSRRKQRTDGMTDGFAGHPVLQDGIVVKSPVRIFLIRPAATGGVVRRESRGVDRRQSVAAIAGDADLVCGQKGAQYNGEPPDFLVGCVKRVMQARRINVGAAGELKLRVVATVSAVPKSITVHRRLRVVEDDFAQAP